MRYQASDLNEGSTYQSHCANLTSSKAKTVTLQMALMSQFAFAPPPRFQQEGGFSRHSRRL